MSCNNVVWWIHFLYFSIFYFCSCHNLGRTETWPALFKLGLSYTGMKLVSLYSAVYTVFAVKMSTQNVHRKARLRITELHCQVFVVASIIWRSNLKVTGCNKTKILTGLLFWHFWHALWHRHILQAGVVDTASCVSTTPRPTSHVWQVSLCISLFVTFKTMYGKLTVYAFSRCCLQVRFHGFSQ